MEGPAQRLTFLGVLIDSREFTLALPEQKLQAFTKLVNDLVERKRVTKRQLESLAGKLSWASQVVPGGRTFMRRILDLKNKLVLKSHKAVMSGELKADLQWWQSYLQVFNGTASILDQRPITALHTDASDQGCGAAYLGDYFYINWSEDFPQAMDMHINCKETIAIIASAVRWGHLWKDRQVVVSTDNMTAKSMINKGSCRNSEMMKFLRALFWQSATNNFSIRAVHIPGKDNILADACSRLHECGKLSVVYELMPSLCCGELSVDMLTDHMSSSFIRKKWRTATAEQCAASGVAVQIRCLVGIDEVGIMPHN